MKQGQASSNAYDPKTEPNSRAVDPCAAGQIGLAQARMAAVEPLYQGRGFEAPKTDTTIHHSGSQGKHR